MLIGENKNLRTYLDTYSLPEVDTQISLQIVTTW